MWWSARFRKSGRAHGEVRAHHSILLLANSTDRKEIIHTAERPGRFAHVDNYPGRFGADSRNLLKLFGGCRIDVQRLSGGMLLGDCRRGEKEKTRKAKINAENTDAQRDSFRLGWNLRSVPFAPRTCQERERHFAQARPGRRERASLTPLGITTHSSFSTDRSRMLPCASYTVSSPKSLACASTSFRSPTTTICAFAELKYFRAAARTSSEVKARTRSR